MLRDIIRQISDGESPYPGLTVGVVDERSEIAGCYLGVAQNDVGIRTDVLDCCPKAEGMMMLIRAMSPRCGWQSMRSERGEDIPCDRVRR